MPSSRGIRSNVSQDPSASAETSIPDVPSGRRSTPEPYGGPTGRVRSRAARETRYGGPIDWSLFHSLNSSLQGHDTIADALASFVDTWAVPVFVLAFFALWLLDRPGSPSRWKVAVLSGLASAAVGLATSQVINHIWERTRPADAHPADTLLLVPASHDPSFPSEHAVASFAIAFSVLFVGGRIAGALFLAYASVLSASRIFVGLHYPGDVLGGFAVGLGAALVVYYVGRDRWAPVVSLLSRLTDPIVAPVWRALDARRARRGSRGTTPAS